MSSSLRQITILVCCVVCVFCLQAAKYEFSGFARLDNAFDTRQCVGSDDGAVIYYPALPEYDANGNDINAHSHFAMTPAVTRLTFKVSDMRVKQCDLLAHVETDFTGVLDAVGSSAYTAGLLKMRKAYFKATWPHTWILVGQTEHPLYVADCAPNCVNFNGGMPIASYARCPEFIVEHQWCNLFFNFAIYSQFLYQSPGPCGSSGAYITKCISRTYMRHSLTPGISLAVEYRKPAVVAGLLFTVRRLQPALFTVGALDVASTATTVKKYVSNQLITSVIGSAWLGLRWEHLRINNQIMLGQNGLDFNTLGGYAVSCYNTTTGACTYTNVNYLGLWSDVEYGKYKSLTPGLFVGVVKNLGARQPVYLNPTTSVPMFYGFDYRVDAIFRFAPRIVTRFYNTYVGFEFDASRVRFGAMNSCGKHPCTSSVSSVRVLLQAHYDF